MGGPIRPFIAEDSQNEASGNDVESLRIAAETTLVQFIVRACSRGKPQQSRS